MVGVEDLLAFFVRGKIIRDNLVTKVRVNGSIVGRVMTNDNANDSDIRGIIGRET